MSKKQPKKHEPIAKAEDVEFPYELADSEDLEAMERMKKADQRAENQNK